MKSHTRHIRTSLFLWTILISLVSSCTFRIEKLEQPLVTIPPPATLPALTDTPTPPPTMESIATPTTQATVDLSLEECIPVEEKIPDDLNLSGIWVRNSGRPYLETMDGRTAYGVPLRGGGIFSTSKGDMAISPDGRYLAYIDSYLDDTGRTKSRILRIINSSGHSLPMDYWIIDWQWLIGWKDNKHIAVFTGQKEILILDPFTGRWEKLQAPAWLGKIVYDYYGNDGPFYSPSLDRILIKPDYSIFELRNFQTGQTIYKGNRYLDGWDLDWSADGSTLAIGSEKFLNVITRNQEQVEFDASKLGINSVNYPKLSPNGQKLVFTSYWSGKLFFFDIKQLEITKLCTDDFDFLTQAVWSPDGRFVVQETDRSYSDPFDLLIDTQQLRAYKLTSGQYQHRLAWLAEP
ncbi:MAG TPA: WD40 repeat domain-containing protein [Anaerolineales bacterium]|nr:WD40 repeat domain-containing protein [Anaerolineales bacterium]